MYLCLDSCGEQAILVLGNYQSSKCNSNILDYRLIDTTLPILKQNLDKVGKLLDTLQQLMISCRCQWSDLKALLVVNGPGRYTGLRLGLAMMYGIKANIPLYGLRRDQVYGHLIKEGMILMDSGKSAAFFTQLNHNKLKTNNYCSKIVLLNDAQALSQYLQTLHKKILCLITKQALYSQYPKLSTAIKNRGGSYFFPDMYTRAQALISSLVVLHTKNYSNTNNMAQQLSDQFVFYGAEPVASSKID